MFKVSENYGIAPEGRHNAKIIESKPALKDGYTKISFRLENGKIVSNLYQNEFYQNSRTDQLLRAFTGGKVPKKFDEKQLIGAKCVIEIVHEEKNSGIYDNVAKITFSENDEDILEEDQDEEEILEEDDDDDDSDDSDYEEEDDDDVNDEEEEEKLPQRKPLKKKIK